MKEVSISFLKDGNYTEYIDSINYSSADYIHFDVMDGKFVKRENLSLSELDKYLSISGKMNDVHLMVSNPSDYIDVCSLHNVNNITIHREIEDYKKYITLIKNLGIKVGLAINPDTDISLIYDDLDNIDLVLVMGVYPGYSGQSFISNTTSKIKLLKEEIDKRSLNVKIAIDGGVKEDTLSLVKDADIIVSSSYLLNNLDKIDEIKKLLF